jgi:hypothetical protein
MLARSTLCFLCLVASCCSAATEKAGADYERLVEHAKAGDKTVDFRELRLAYANSPNYESGPDTDPQKKAMWAALNGRDFAKALKTADVVLAINYVDMDAHFAEYVAHRELKEQELADLHNFILRGLLKSIADSGDGKTPETSFQVIEVHEEYVFLRTMGVGLPEKQSLLQKNGHSYDAITFEDPASKQKVTLYFNVDIPVKHGL